MSDASVSTEKPSHSVTSGTRHWTSQESRLLVPFQRQTTVELPWHRGSYAASVSDGQRKTPAVSYTSMTMLHTVPRRCPCRDVNFVRRLKAERRVLPSAIVSVQLVSAGVGHSSRKLYGNFCRHNNRGQHGLQTVPADLVLKHADNPVSVSMWRPEESSRWAATPSYFHPPYQHGAPTCYRAGCCSA